MLEFVRPDHGRRPVPDWRARVHALLARHHGVVAVREAMALGASRRALYGDIDRGRLELVLPGVLRSTHWPMGREQRMVAACARNPEVLVAFSTAAQLWSMRRIPPDLAVHVLVRHGCSPELDGVVVHRCRRIDAVDVSRRDDGIRLTSPPRTLFDCADVLGFEAASSVLEQLLDDGRGTFATHLATWVRLAHPRRPGTATMTRLLGSRPAWRAALQSDLEARVLREIETQRLPRPEVQWPVTLVGGRSIRLDFAWPHHQVALEVDHPFWHAGAAESHRDRDRDRQLMTMGWLVPRITDVDVETGLASSVAQVGLIVRSRPAVA